MSPNIISTAANVELFKDKAASPKHNAQMNLSGRTHYVDDDTMRFFGSKIISARPTDDGLFFKIIESVALTYDKSRRGYRVVVFDLFGHPVFRPNLEGCTGSRAAAENYYTKHHDTDTWKHYRAELKIRAARLAAQAAAMREAAATLEEVPA
jgi:hypothetical protein